MNSRDSVGAILTEVSGIGERLARKIIDEFGGEDELLKAVKNLEIDRLVAIEGISQRRAIEIANKLLGNSLPSFLKTEKAFQIYRDILELMMSYAHTDYARNRIMLLHPSTDTTSIREHIRMVIEAKKMVGELPVEKLRGLLSNIDRPRDPPINFNPSKAILVETREDYDLLIDMGLNRYHPVILNPEPGELDEYELIIYVYSEGMLELEDTFSTIMVTADSDKHEIVPECVLNYFRKNLELFRNALEIKSMLGMETCLHEVVEIMDELQAAGDEEVDIDEVVNSVKAWADTKLRDLIKDIDLSGDEVLTLLNQGMTAKLERIFDDVLSEARSMIRKRSGVEFDPFIKSYPLKIDQREVERVKRLEAASRNLREFEVKVDAATRLDELRVAVEGEIRDIMEFDYRLALGLFAHEYELTEPEFGDEISLRGALHLNLVGSGKPQRVDYRIGDPDNVVLLTGANSGGKTTLLETLAQVTIMAQMGLPVCALEARVRIVDEVYFISKKRSLDAGAFESFIRTFTPITTSENSKLILLDELEAITELEAAVKIIATFIEFIGESSSLAVIVTHMAREIMKYVDVRVDGIEARGLDDDYNLIVDRTPRINYLARSTPELIIRMIYEKSSADERIVYGRILEKFQKTDKAEEQ
ncbi:endonuclease MutS2 [Methanothermobacter sp. EMTCatA1]|uniref:endonuclease MutS2 n=1 Tax=Methanothermobacter sp. EMTCatA1 TaxID=2017966 RepID=UPI000B62055C|nr:endonuclease MutS2 [Methanothermobacter sp. EMTCatA1]BAZ99747.1 Endonuclease MutS2 [Methanothermobacter sp. EMTCatA1]